MGIFPWSRATPASTAEAVDIGDKCSNGLLVKRAFLLRRGERRVRRAVEEPNPLILGSPALSINSSLPEDENGCRADWERGKGSPQGATLFPFLFTPSPASLLSSQGYNRVRYLVTPLPLALHFVTRSALAARGHRYFLVSLLYLYSLTPLFLLY